MTSLRAELHELLLDHDGDADGACDAVMELLAGKLGATQEKLLSERDAYRSKCVALERKCEALMGQIKDLIGQAGDNHDGN